MIDSRFKTNCIHGIPLRMVCSECREEAGRRPGCAACIEKDAEIERLRKAIFAWAELEYMDKAHDPDRWERYLRAGTRLVEIAREGR